MRFQLILKMGVIVLILTLSRGRVLAMDGGLNQENRSPSIQSAEEKGRNRPTATELTSMENRLEVMEKEFQKLKEANLQQNHNSIVSYGSLKIKTVLQSNFDFDDGTTTITTFRLNRFRIILLGETPFKKISYVMQADLARTAAPILLDAKIIFDYIPHTKINLGRFVPNLGYYMPRPVSDLDFILYPLIVQKYNSAGNFRADGIQADVRFKWINFNAAVFNGFPDNPTATVDNNKEKDGFARIDVIPINGLTIYGYRWEGREYNAVRTNWHKSRTGGGAFYERKNLKFVGEYMNGQDERLNNTISQGGFINMGFHLCPWLEILGRFDYFDPDIHIINNSEQWRTVGANVFQDKLNVKYSLNYVFKNEASHEIKNDMALMQVQLAF